MYTKEYENTLSKCIVIETTKDLISDQAAAFKKGEQAKHTQSKTTWKKQSENYAKSRKSDQVKTL